MESNMTKRFKIEPDLTCPELAGYKLPQIEPDGVGQPLTDYIKEKHNQAECIGFIDGYNKAREKFEFTESDLRQAVALSLDDAEKSVIWSKEWYPNKLADKIIASLRTQRTPIAIEVEMVESPSYNAIRMQDKNDCFAYFIPATNPDGTVKGVYIYE